MRHLFAGLFASLMVVALCAGQAIADSVEVKGPHICCQQCVNVVGKILAKVEGVSDAKADQATKTVTFTAKDEKAAKAGVKALFDGGLFGAATSDGKELKLDVSTPTKGVKADVIVVKDVHVCCGQCQKGIAKVFKDAKITYEGKGPQRTVRIESPGLESSSVLEALRKAGFNGNVEK
jgi:copper chaperone CopZ